MLPYVIRISAQIGSSSSCPKRAATDDDRLDHQPRPFMPRDRACLLACCIDLWTINDDDDDIKMNWNDRTTIRPQMKLDSDKDDDEEEEEEEEQEEEEKEVNVSEAAAGAIFAHHLARGKQQQQQQQQQYSSKLRNDRSNFSLLLFPLSHFLKVTQRIKCVTQNAYRQTDRRLQK